ncbi:PE family protein, partial [Mycobacterium tuberculosis]|uniref:PE family protein n=1 Tax=Mycobacterium tuberculosis TaxID=1773 RepID=UPI001F251F0A
MSFVLIAPEFVTAAAGDLTNLGSSISAANASAASATTQVLAAGADEVSARIAALFGGFGLEYQAISAQVAAYHQRFVQALSTGAGAYASAEAAAAEQIVLGVINAPTQALLGRPLIGDGANATTPGGAGGAGGLLFGGFGLEYQAISAQVAAYHQRFVQASSTGAGAYASAEAAAAEQIVLGVINAPTQALLGRPLIG